jgi:hypothetical protein
MVKRICKYSLMVVTVASIASVASQNVGASMHPGDAIRVGQCEYSPSGTKTLCFGVTNGWYGLATTYVYCSFNVWTSRFDGWNAANLPCAAGGTHTDQWADGTSSASAEMQSDGNFVLYTAPGGTPVWATSTFNTNNPSFEVQDDGNLVIYAGGVPIWSVF